MRHHPVFLLAALVCSFAMVPVSTTGQSQSQQTAPQPPVASTPTQTPQGQPIPAAQQGQSKVWTNDEIDNLRDDHSVSVVGKNPPPKKVTATTAKTQGQQKDPAWYRNQITSLQADIATLDPQIAKIQAFPNGENESEAASAHPKLKPTPREQLKQMQTKRQADETRLDDLVDLARHNGIAPGQLR